MAKRKMNYLIPGIIALVFGVAAACMMFLDAVKYDILIGDVTFTGMQLAFGYKESALGVSVTVWEFNIMITLAFLLPVAGGIVAVVTQNGLISKIISTACFVVGAVFLFSMTAYLGIGGNEYSSEGAALAVGPIIAGVLAILGAAVCFFKGTLAKAIK